jgi:hypothetical protein
LHNLVRLTTSERQLLAGPAPPGLLPGRSEPLGYPLPLAGRVKGHEVAGHQLRFPGAGVGSSDEETLASLGSVGLGPGIVVAEQDGPPIPHRAEIHFVIDVLRRLRVVLLNAGVLFAKGQHIERVRRVNGELGVFWHVSGPLFMEMF